LRHAAAAGVSDGWASASAGKSGLSRVIERMFRPRLMSGERGEGVVREEVGRNRLERGDVLLLHIEREVEQRGRRLAPVDTAERP
jgi:hypothetical protein